MFTFSYKKLFPDVSLSVKKYEYIWWLIASNYRTFVVKLFLWIIHVLLLMRAIISSGQCFKLWYCSHKLNVCVYICSLDLEVKKKASILFGIRLDEGKYGKLVEQLNGIYGARNLVSYNHKDFVYLGFLLSNSFKQ